MEKTRPEMSFQQGNCRVSIFINEATKNGNIIKIRKASFQKRYLDKNGEWNSTNTLDTNDIPKAILCLTKAYDYLTAKQENNGD